MDKNSELRIKELHPQLQQKIRDLHAACIKEGIDFIISQGLRAKEDQDVLYAQGRTKPGKKVTWVKWPYAPHCWGIAFDVARWIDKDGDRIVDSNEIDWNEPSYNRIGVLGRSLGLIWGGDFPAGQKDRPHFQLLGYVFTPANLWRKYGTFEKFKATWPK